MLMSHIFNSVIVAGVRPGAVGLPHGLQHLELEGDAPDVVRVVRVPRVEERVLRRRAAELPRPERPQTTAGINIFHFKFK